MGIMNWLFGKKKTVVQHTIKKETVCEGNTQITTTKIGDSVVGIQAEYIPQKINGVPTYELAETHKHDIDMMLSCCKSEMNNFHKTGEAPAPFYFNRVAILAKKAKNFALEVEICESYLKAVEEFRNGPNFDARFPSITKSPKTADMRKRLPKAKANLEKQRNNQ